MDSEEREATKAELRAAKDAGDISLREYLEEPRVAIFGPRPARLDAGRRHERANEEEAAAARGSKRATMEPEPQSPAAPWRARRRPQGVM